MKDPALQPHEEKLVATARDFARQVVGPQAAAWERERRVPRETLGEAAQAGLAGLLVPAAWGGSDVSYTAMARIKEELSRACMAFAFSLVCHNNLAGNIARNGTDAQRERYLRPMVRGERIGAFLLTEPGAGSDAAAISTRAEPTTDGWRLNGTKAWVTNGVIGDVLSVYAQSDPSQGWRGVVCLLVDAETPGVTREAGYGLLSGHAMGVSDVTLRDCHVGAGQLLLGAQAAFRGAMAGINIARANVAAMCCGMLAAGLERALEHTAERRAFGQSIAGFQGVQWQLADVATDLEAARLLAYQATRAIDAGETGALEAAHAKKFATRVTLSGLVDCMQVMGANGFRSEEVLGRHLGFAKLTQWMDGATEIQNVVISRELLRRRGVVTA